VGLEWEFAADVVERITVFVERWLSVIGSVIDARNGPNPNVMNCFNLEAVFPDPSFLYDLRKLYVAQCGRLTLHVLSELPFQTIGTGEHLMDKFMGDPSLQLMEEIFDTNLHMNNSFIYYNFFELAMRRMRVGYYLSQNSTDNSQEVRQLKDEITRKYLTVCSLLSKLRV
jgi:hypothetical protein